MIGDGLSRREREILEVLHRKQRASVGDVVAELESAPSYSAVRSLLRILEDKGHARHVEDGRRFVYLPTEPRKRAAGSALKQVIETFFGGNLHQAVAAFLNDSDTKITDDELDRLSEVVAGARVDEQKSSDHVESEKK
jgi:predicted transcriptional regulator